MSSFALVLVPILGAIAMAWPRARERASAWLVAVALIATTLAFWQMGGPAPALRFADLLCLDASSRLFLALVNPIYLGVALHVHHRATTTPELRPSMGKFVALALLFLASANLALIANHFLVCWIALETSTLAAAPLIVRPGVRSSRQAAFRYLLFSSVALSLVMLGFGCLTRSLEQAGLAVSLAFDQVSLAGTPALDAMGTLGLCLVLLGLGTKLGLVPMYSWLPETYDEAPPAVAALLGAVQFNCVLFLLLRVVQVYRPGNAALISHQLVWMGVLSMLVSTISIIATHNLKRLIAYASINHAGVIAVGLGTGKSASYGLLLYVLSNAFIKAILFLTAGKIIAHCRTKDTRTISGLIKDMPYSGVFLMVGTFALLGLPPFGSFFGELLILSALVSTGQTFVFASFCVLISVSFVATGRTIFPVIWGEPRQRQLWPPQTFVGAAPKIAFVVMLVVLGVYIPPVVNQLILRVASTLSQS